MSEKQDVKSKRKKLTKFKILILILFLFLLGGIVIQYRVGTKSKLHRKIEEFRAAGYPVTLKELDELYTIPEGAENAADYIMDAISDYNEPNDPMLLNVNEWSALFPKGEVLPDKLMRNISQYLQDNQKSLELLHKAAALEYCRYPIDLSINQNLKYVDIVKMVRLLCLEAVIHAQNGDSESAVDSLICSFNIVDTINDMPLLISHIAEMAYRDFNITTLELVINTTDLTEEQLVQLRDTITDILGSFDLSYGFKGELCKTIYDIENISSIIRSDDSGFSRPQKVIYSIYNSFGLAKSDGIIYLDIISKYIEACKLPLHERMEAAQQIQNEIANISGIHILLQGIAPNYARYITRELTNISRLRVALASLAIQRYRLRNGKLPDSLNELVPEFLEEVPLDPYDGKELRYKKLDKGFVVYSIDEDLRDDNGQEEPKISNQKPSNWDITFTIKK